MQDSAASVLTMVAWLVHPPLTLIHLIHLFQLTFMMMKEKKAVNKMKMTSEAFRRPPQ
jgi:hypothetical protein